MALTESQILETLRSIPAPQGGDVVGAGMISSLALREGHVAFTIEVDPKIAPQLEPLRKAAEQAVMKMPGVLSVSAVLTAHRASTQAPAQQKPASGHAHGHGAGHGGIQKMSLPAVR